MAIRWFVILGLIAVFSFGSSNSELVGGYGEERPATESIWNIVNMVEPAVEREWGRVCKSNKLDDCSIDVFNPVSFRSQVVNGVNYIIKVKIQHDRHIVIKVYMPPLYAHTSTRIPQLEGVIPYQGGPIDYQAFH